MTQKRNYIRDEIRYIGRDGQRNVVDWYGNEVGGELTSVGHALVHVNQSPSCMHAYMIYAMHAANQGSSISFAQLAAP